MFSRLYGSAIIPPHHEGQTSITHRICGLRKAMFWLTLSLAVTTIVAVFGGSLGGTLLLRRSQAKEADRENSGE